MFCSYYALISFQPNAFTKKVTCRTHLELTEYITSFLVFFSSPNFPLVTQFSVPMTLAFFACFNSISTAFLYITLGYFHWRVSCTINIFLVMVSILIISLLCPFIILIPYQRDAIAYALTIWILFHPVSFEHCTKFSLRKFSIFSCCFSSVSIILWTSSTLRYLYLYISICLIQTIFSNSIPSRDCVLYILRWIIPHFMSQIKF